MSTDTPNTQDANEDADPETVAALRDRVADLESRLADVESETSEDGKSMVIVSTKGTLDMAYPPLILASTAAAFDWDVTVFHTFWGLELLHEEHSADLKLSSVGNPNMPVPNALAALPGMDEVTTRLMRKRIADNETPTIEELVETSLEMGVDLQACQMTIDLLDYDENDFYDGVTVGVGAATALQRMGEADVQLLV
ncbi:DsrE/DsrF/DrsH-like family protein [Halomarina litorea]|uniref:DsrE/DsrF/DrsH-like family protein n=1 Tax=Halomarina litorea TaxID=2961595 RepID=UPI0020C57870|nr:DsrE/DsrF/DrsH-like family protein [Halomarina sp. BCD28]